MDASTSVRTFFFPLCLFFTAETWINKHWRYFSFNSVVLGYGLGMAWWLKDVMLCLMEPVLVDEERSTQFSSIPCTTVGRRH